LGHACEPEHGQRPEQEVYGHIERWRNPSLEGEYTYVYRDGIDLKRSWGGEVRNVAVLVAIGVDPDGYRNVLGVAEGAKEDKTSWTGFLRHLKERGLKGVQLIVSDKCLGLVESLADFFPDAEWQRWVVPFYRNVFTTVPKSKVKEVAVMLKAIHAQEARPEAEEKLQAVGAKLESMKLMKAAGLVREGAPETLSYYGFPQAHWRRSRTSNPLERVLREIRRCTRIVGAFPDGESALMLVAVRLRHIAGSKWGTKRYLSMDRIDEQALSEEIERAI